MEVEFLQDMLPSLAIAVTLAADAMTDFWMEQFGWESGGMPNKKCFVLRPRRWFEDVFVLNPCMWKGSSFTKML